MNKIKSLLTVSATFFSLAIFACGPYFPETYIDGNNHWNYLTKPSEYKYNWYQEFTYVAKEKFGDYSKWYIYKDSDISTERGKIIDYQEKVSPNNKYDRSIIEFELYEKGAEEMRRDKNPEKIPEAWLKLLSLPWEKRRYRTTWAYYMVGNLHSNAGIKELAEKFYEKVRASYRKGFKDTLGLAHATYKREFLSASDPEQKLNAALKAFAYYDRTKDYKRFRFIVEQTEYYLKKLHTSGFSFKKLTKDPNLKELIISFMLGNYGVWNSLDNNGVLNPHISKLIDGCDSETVARFAWLAYRTGDITLAKKLTPAAKKGGLLTLWLQAKIALYENNDSLAAKYLRQWIEICNKNKKQLAGSRLAPGFNSKTKAEKDVYGNLGSAIIHTRDFTEALDCFIRADDWPSAAVVADNLIPLNDLKKYVDSNVPDYFYETFNNNVKKGFDRRTCRIIWESNTYKTQAQANTYNAEKGIKNQLRYLLARRLVRNKKLGTAIPYIPVDLFKPLQSLEYYSRRLKNKKLDNDERALAAYNAARIMRWYGMSLSGTELWPDYQYLGGYFNYFSISRNWAEKRNLEEIEKIAKKNAPTPNRRFHYRFKACKLMEECIALAENEDLKLLANLAAGYWLYKKYPKEADPFYKAAVKFKPKPISIVLDKLRWFPAKKELPKAIYNQIFSSKAVKNIDDLNKITNLSMKNGRL